MAQNNKISKQQYQNNRQDVILKFKISRAKFWNKNTNIITIHQNLYANNIQVTKEVQ